MSDRLEQQFETIRPLVARFQEQFHSQLDAMGPALAAFEEQMKGLNTPEQRRFIEQAMQTVREIEERQEAARAIDGMTLPPQLTLPEPPPVGWSGVEESDVTRPRRPIGFAPWPEDD